MLQDALDDVSGGKVMLSKQFIPTLPFEDYKWKWACMTCTESINDPVVLLGVLSRMRKLEPLKVSYSSNQFAEEMVNLSKDISDSIGVDLARRTGPRNLIRNSGQYWKAVGLIPRVSHGAIELTDLGRKVADHIISQSEFAAITVQTFRLPNMAIQGRGECQRWYDHNIVFHPLKLLLQIELRLNELGEGFITPFELVNIIIPLTGEIGSKNSPDIQDYVNFIIWYRTKEITLDNWPNCCPAANDKRIAREFLLFLHNYGYLKRNDMDKNSNEHYYIDQEVLHEIETIVQNDSEDKSLQSVIEEIRASEVLFDFDRKRAASEYRSIKNRSRQVQFRSDVLDTFKHCIITNVEEHQQLEAAHIKPLRYNGCDEIANGMAMRKDIHLLFDTGNLRISPAGEVELSSIARENYGWSIPHRIVIPDKINKEYLRWRWENYNGI